MKIVKPEPGLRHTDGSVKIGCKQHESMDPACLVSEVQADGGGVMVWEMFFMAHFGLVITN